MYAVIRTGGKQYRVAPEDVIEIEKLDATEGDVVEFGDVLMIGKDGDQPQIGAPVIDGARVSAEVLEQGRGEKIIVFKKKRRQNYRRKNGHRQHLTTVRVLEVLGAGEGSGAKAKAKPGQGGKSQKAAAKDKEATASKPSGSAKAEKAATDKPAKSGTKAKTAGFKKLKAPQGEADNLKALPGVGPKLAERLNDYGIFHFHQLAAMTAEDVAAMDQALDLKGRAERDNWVEEARKLMGGAEG